MENQKFSRHTRFGEAGSGNGPDAKRGQIGVLTLPGQETENYVRFPEGGEAFYPAHQVMMLKDKQEILMT
jgi:hypothetical protein